MNHASGNAQLVTLSPDELHPHPKNPRIALRDDVIGQIKAELERTGFGSQHAVTVRDVGGRYEIVSGHHRAEAARQAGVDVPAWIVELDEDEAFMQLVLSNSQGELSPLEIGLHALHAVPVSVGGRGQKGGLSEYADRLGRGVSSVSQLRTAADVLQTLYASKGFPEALGDKAKHLYEVSKAPRELWPSLVAALREKAWTVAETATHVAGLTAIDVPERFAHWLTPEQISDRYMDGRFSARTVSKLVAAATQVEDWLADHGTDDQRAEWDAWLPTAPFDHREIVAYQQRLLAGQFEVAGWHQGNWRDHLDELEDGSVSLVLTDPPYGVAYQSNYRNEKHEVIASDATPAEGATELKAALAGLYDKLTDDAHVLVFTAGSVEQLTVQACEAVGLTVRSRLVWDKQRTSMGDLDGSFAPRHERIIHATKGKPKLHTRAPDVLTHARADSSRHPTEKPVPLLAELIEATTASGTIVADPFGGVGSTAVAAKETGRKWWSCELSADYHAAGEERLS